MKIDYAIIIAKANERKDALMAFERAVSRLAGEINEQPNELIEAMTEFKQRASQLDTEAVALVGEAKLHCLLNFTQTVLAYWAYVDKRDDYRKITPREALYALDDGGDPE